MTKTALITGASRGIGAATALHLAQQGYNICINYKSNESAANSLIQELQTHDIKAIAVQADVSIESEILRLFQTIDNELGPITVLVNNVGILFPQMRVENITAERVNQLLTTNVTSFFLCSKEAIKRMSTKHGGNGGAIVNVSSCASKTGSPNEYVDYAATKGAIDTFTRGLSLEIANEGIRVNCVRPGFIRTDIHSDGGEPNRLRRIKKSIPMKRGGEPEEVAAAIAWLLSDEASYVTGTFIDVAGGR